MESLIIDSGYSSIKTVYKDQWKKVPSSIKFSANTGMTAGEVVNEHTFEGDKYIIGDISVDEESFATTDFQFKYKFEPLIIKHIRDVFKIPDSEVVNVVLSLALVDWDKKSKLIERCVEYEIDGKVIRNNINVIPQGIGAYYDFVHNQNGDSHPSSSYLIDIGFNTINVAYFQNGIPIREKCKGYPSHGVTSIIRPFTTFLESTYSLPFSEQEAVRIFVANKFIYRGEEQTSISETIQMYKKQFIKKLFNSILIQDKKLLTTSEKVILAGGGCYFLDDTEFPKNTVFVTKPFEYSNLKGMHYLSGANQ